jgi:hypothetical protein
MSAKHHLHTVAALPAHIDPSAVIAALHDHNTALTLQALTQGHEKLAATNAQTLTDTYWYPTDMNPVHSYKVTEVITFLPGIGEWGRKYLSFPTCFQDTPTGLKTRADTSGLILRAEFRVARGGAEAEVEGEGGGVGDAEWVLIEDVEVTCAWYLMPFVKGKMEMAHRDICAKIIEKVIMEHRQNVVADGGRHSVESPHKGKGVLNKEEHMPTVLVQGERQLAQDVFEVDGLDTQRMELQAADVPEKVRSLLCRHCETSTDFVFSPSRSRIARPSRLQTQVSLSFCR